MVSNIQSSFNLKKIILPVFILVLVLLVIKMELFRVVSESMNPSLNKGDILIGLKYYNKTQLNGIKNGDIVMFHFPIEDTIYSRFDDIWYYYHSKIKGIENALDDTFRYGKLKYQDINKRQIQVKRCIGVPGDTIQIKKNELFVNSTFLKENYIQIEKSEFKKGLKRKAKKDTIAREKRFKWCFPHDWKYNWHVHTYGPITIPKRNQIVEINQNTIPFYKRIIAIYENNQLTIKNDSIFINSIYATKYKIKQNYYFVLGDNRLQSLDSRGWGFVPADHIRGKFLFRIYKASSTEY